MASADGKQSSPAGGRTVLRRIVAIAVAAFVGFCLLMFLGDAIPAWLLTAREHNRRMECMNHLRAIGQGCIRYSVDHRDFYPTLSTPNNPASRPMASLALLYDNYVPMKKAFVCPSTADSCEDLRPGQPFQPHGAPSAPGDHRQCSYAYDDTHVDPLTNPDSPIAGDAPSAAAIPYQHGAYRSSDTHSGEGQNVLFYNGNVKWCPKADDIELYRTGAPRKP